MRIGCSQDKRNNERFDGDSSAVRVLDCDRRGVHVLHVSANTVVQGRYCSQCAACSGVTTVCRISQLLDLCLDEVSAMGKQRRRKKAHDRTARVGES